MTLDGLRTASASSVGDLTLAVVVGAGRYVDSKIRPLPAATREAVAIRDALIRPNGCRVPPENVVLLIDSDANRAQILAAIKDSCQRATPNHSLFIYFAGHGIDVGAQFALGAFDTSLSAFLETAVSSNDLEDVLRGVPARGVFLVLDCCGGAALAEGAPGVFRTVGQSAAYRILLSSARVGQSSWEGTRGSTFSRALVEVLNGTSRLASDGGTIYFSDLYRFLHDRVTVEMEAAGPDGVAQEPIATGSYVRDPLLFLHAGLTLDQVKVRVQRYSKENVRHILWKWIGGSAAAAVVVMLGVWAFVAGHHFLQVDDGVVALYRGHPHLRMFAYPHLVWQYDVRADEIKSESPLAVARPVVSSWGQDFREEALRQLNSVGRARWFINEKQLPEAQAEISKLLGDPSKTAEWTKGALMAISIASAEHVPQLNAFAKGAQANVATSALSRLMELSPERGAAVASEMGFGQGTRAIHLQVLADLPAGCAAGTQNYLDGFGAEESNAQFARLEIDAALRTGCKLSRGAIGAIRQPTYLESVARYLDLADPSTAIELRSLFLRSFESHLGGGTGGVPMSLNVAAGYLTGALPASDCPASGTFDLPGGVAAKLSAARAIVRQCSGASLRLSPATNPQAFRCELALEGLPESPLFAIDIPYRDGFSTMWPILDAFRFRGAAQSSLVLERLATTHADPTLRRHAARLLRYAQIPARVDLATFERTGDQGLQLETYLWAAQTDREKVLARVRDRLLDDTADFLPLVVSKLLLSGEERQALLAAAQSRQVSERMRATMIAMLGDASAVARQLTDANTKHRGWAGDWLSVREDLDRVAELLPKKNWHGQIAAADLHRMIEKRAKLAKELEALTPETKSWRIRLILDMRQIDNSGLRAWLQTQCQWCD